MNKPAESINAFSTPKQLLENYPYARQIGWTSEEIEFLFDNKLIEGQRTDELRVSNESFERILDFHSGQQES